MLLAAFLKHFESLPPERDRTLAASSAGSCGRRLAYAQWPEYFPPEPMTPRRRARLMAGKEFERIVQGVIQQALPAEAAGETAFLWPIPVDAATMATACEKVAADRVNGHVLPDMNPNDLPRWRAACVAKGMHRLSGLVLDPPNLLVYIPALADGVVDLSAIGYGIGTQEFKTMATAGFRMMLRGTLDYGYAVQCAIQVDAANLDTHVLLVYRLETSHAIEVIYSRKADRVRATFTLTNGSTHVSEGAIEPPLDEWDELIVETPFDESLLTQARARIRAVLNATPTTLPAREYGPRFTCRDCEHGKIKCGFCDADGISTRSKTKKDGTPKAGKVCGREGCVAGYRTCEKCAGGRLHETTLPFPCNGWCPFLASCWVDAAGEPLYRIEKPTRPGDAGGRPKFKMTRADYEASGLTFTNPEGR